VKDFEMKGWRESPRENGEKNTHTTITIRIDKELLQKMDIYLAKLQLTGVADMPKNRTQFVNYLIEGEIANGCILQSGVQGKGI
jgi:hypothetical protein